MKLTLLILSSLVLVLGGWITPAQGQTQTPETTPTPQTETTLTYSDYMSLGYSAQQQEQYQQAARYFRSALELNPGDRAATVAYWNMINTLQGQAAPVLPFDEYMNQGYAATTAGDYTAALENFQQALALRPGDYYATQAILNVQTYLNSEQIINPAEATEATEANGMTGATAAPAVPETPYNRSMRLGYAALQEAEFIIASEHFRNALLARPDDRWATIAYWNAVAETLDDTEVESRYDRFMRLGYDATERGDYESAVAFFQEALADRPNDYYATEAINNVSTYLSE